MSKTDYNEKIKGLNASLVKANETLKKAKEPKDVEDAKKAVEAIKGEITKAKKALQKEAEVKNIGAVKAKAEIAIMDRYKVDSLFINSKGNYFTNKSFAENSEKDKTKVKELTREVLTALIK